MTSLRGTKRRLDLESDSPEPAETLTTEGSFVTAEEGTLPPVSSFDDDDDDMTEVSSPARPGRVRKWSKQVKRLNEDAANFAKARTLLRHTSQAPAGPSQREQRAQLRAQRLEQKTAGAHHSQEADEMLDDADANELEAAASLVDLMAHEALQETGNDDESQALSQDTGSSADKAFAAAWARVHGNGGSDAAASCRLATAWQARHESPSGMSQLHNQPATRSLAGHPVITQPQATAAEQRLKSAEQPLCAQPRIAAARSPLPADRGAIQQVGHMAEADAADEAVAPDEGQMPDADDLVQEVQSPAHASPHRAAVPQQPGKSPAACLPKAPQQGQPALRSPATGEEAWSPAANTRIGRPSTMLRTALGGRGPATGTGLAGLAAAAGSMQQTKAGRDVPELEARAMQLAMQRLVDREAEQQKQDEAVLQSCPAASLVHIPLWGSSLSPETPGQLQGSLAVPAACSVRLLRRVFARAVQVQPACVQLVMPQGGIALQDFIAGQEASIRQYGLDSSGGRQGLQVQLQLQEGSAKVHALIQQEVDLVKQELLSARLRSPAPMNFTGPSGQGSKSPAGPSVTAVLQSAGWGTTSPAKRIPKALPANKGGRQLAEYEAMLPAQQNHSPGAPVISPGRRRVGRWSQAEVAMLIAKMEAARVWADIRDEWPKLGFPKRSAVDLKDKWRNLEDVVLKAKPTRTVKLTQDQMERIHRCHRKYRTMQASVSPSRFKSPHREQTGPADSTPKKQAETAAVEAADISRNPSDSYRPTPEQSSSSGRDDFGSAAYQDGHNQHVIETPPMTTRSKVHPG